MTAVQTSMEPHDAALAVRDVATRAKHAARTLATASADARRAALHRIADALHAHRAAILDANALDVADGRAAVAAGELTASLLQRLLLDARKLDEMAAHVREVATLDDPLGRVLRHTLLDDGLELRQVSCPIGLLATVFEARPDAMTQIVALALMSGNAVVLKPGREVRRTAHAVLRAMHAALDGDATVPAAAVAMVDDRADVDVLLTLDDVVDLVVPRGSQALVRSIQARTRIPVLGHAEGVCHVYVDAAADVAMALDVVVDSKVQYPAACNAVEVVLVNRAIAPAVVGPLVARLASHGVAMVGDEEVRALAPAGTVDAATDDDWRTEFGDLRVALRVVDDAAAAVAHVNEHGSHHTDAIVTADDATAARFLSLVDSASVFHNASTRFADGFRYGLGAEVGISTGKLHARGPVGLDGLTTHKWLLRGDGHRVATYAGADGRPFRHVAL